MTAHRSGDTSGHPAGEAAGSAPAAHPSALEASTPEDVLAAVPVVLGFEPAQSVVMLTFGGQETFHARIDLPRAAGEVRWIVDQLLEPARSHRVARVLFVAYADDSALTRAVLRRLRRDFVRSGIDVVEVFRVHDGRWFSPGRPGVPRWGVAYDVGDHRFRAQAVVEGIVVHRSRAELAALLDTRPDAVEAVVAELPGAVPSPPGEVQDLVALRLRTGRFTDAELARLLLGLSDGATRDAAWGAMTRAQATHHVRLWTDAVQRAPDPLVPGPAAVLAVAAWLAGHGALAWCAVDRCRAVDPGHTLAALVAELLVAAVAPTAAVEPAALR